MFVCAETVATPDTSKATIESFMAVFRARMRYLVNLPPQSRLLGVIYWIHLPQPCNDHDALHDSNVVKSSELEAWPPHSCMRGLTLAGSVMLDSMRCQGPSSLVKVTRLAKSAKQERQDIDGGRRSASDERLLGNEDNDIVAFYDVSTV